MHPHVFPFRRFAAVGSIVLGLAFALPPAGQAVAGEGPGSIPDGPWDAADFAVYDHKVHSRLPSHPRCRDSGDPECADTDDVIWKMGPIGIDDPLHRNVWGDGVYYQLEKTYTIDLKPYILDYNNYHPGDLPAYCASQDNRDFWYYDFKDIAPLEDGELRLQNLVLTIKRGYRWDGPSLEWPTYTYPSKIHTFKRKGAKPLGLMRASLVHDALYGFQRRNEYPPDTAPGHRPDDGRWQFRLMADCMLYMLSRQDGNDEGTWLIEGTARYSFFWVRFGGWFYTGHYPVPDWGYHAQAEAGPDQRHECAAADGIDVDLNGSASIDAEFVHWDWGFGVSGDLEPQVRFPVGVRTAKLTVSDADDFLDGPFWDSDTVKITVLRDSEPPVAAIEPESRVLWPADGGFETVGVRDMVLAVLDNCSSLSPDDAVITQVDSDEPASGDILIAADGKSVDLRRTRLGSGDGRVYTIEIQVSDEAGETATYTYLANVPHSKKP